jgi:hypothetical protein
MNVTSFGFVGQAFRPAAGLPPGAPPKRAAAARKGCPTLAAFLLMASCAFAQAPLKVAAVNSNPAAAGPTSMRQAITAVEKRLDSRLDQVGGKDRVYILGLTRGLYLEGYGAVFTAELDLIESPRPNPFRQQIGPQEAGAVRQRKMQNLALLRKSLRELWADAASQLGSLPDTDQVVVAVRLLYQPWEDTAGLPAQIVVKGPRKANPASIQMEEQ